MKANLFLVVFVILTALGSGAGAATLWGIENEAKARFEAKVVDISCELTGNCPAKCGAGKRQLGLLTDEGRLWLVAKNFDAFAGGTVDLLPFCGKRVLADGLTVATKHMPLFAIQFVKPLPDGEWRRANKFSQDWAKKHGENGNRWFRWDPDVAERISKRGQLGIPGLDLSDQDEDG